MPEITVRTNSAVLEAVKASGQTPVVNVENPMPLSQVEKLYSVLKRRDGRYEGNGGVEGLRWSHKILKQYDRIKSNMEGCFKSDEFLDSYLGPFINLGMTKLSAAEVVKRITVPSIVLAGEDLTLVFMAGTGDEARSAGGVSSQGVLDLENAYVIGKSEYKLKMIRKAAGKKDCSFDTYEIAKIEQDDIDFCSSYALASRTDEKATFTFKVDDSLGLVFGWGLVSKIDGKEYFDTQGDHLTEDGIIKAAMDYMLKYRDMGDMHEIDEEDTDASDGLAEVPYGKIVFCFPLTEEILKAFNIQSNMTGLMVAVKPDDPEILEKFKDGRYTGFSFGGRRIPEYTEEVD